ncbi:hypothetical protein GCM10009839_17120 [Catenulispora yoronensis]|uniref:DUF6879 domain-containing protein n=1 Tax=Catenulispora yoronensis TaxID=450799 RepID=A0ABN2TTD0_9ACTN
MISAKEFGALFGTFDREAFRLETLDDYSGSTSAEKMRAYHAGEPKPEDYNAPWLETIRRNTIAGRRMYRVHVLARPLTDYLRYELEWGYFTNQTAGEEFFILDVTERSNPLAGVPDFWMFDHSSVVSMTYDAAGGFISGEREPDAGKWIEWRDLALSHAEPFTSWWKQHGTER